MRTVAVLGASARRFKFGNKSVRAHAAAAPAEVWFNPGSADDAVLAEARRLGLPAIDGCSIVDLGLSPSEFP